MPITRRHLLQAAATAAGACALPATLSSPALALTSVEHGTGPVGSGWPMFRHDPARTGAVVEGRISPSTVAGLTLSASVTTGRNTLNHSYPMIVDSGYLATDTNTGVAVRTSPRLRALWRKPDYSPGVIEGGALWCAGPTGFDVVDLATGTLRTTLPAAGLLVDGLVVSSALTGSPSGSAESFTVTAHDSTTGEQAWQTTLPGIPQGWLSAWQGSVYLTAFAGTRSHPGRRVFSRLDLATGARVFSRTLTSTGYGEVTSIVDGVAVSPLRGGTATLTAYDAVSGRFLWDLQPVGAESHEMLSVSMAGGVVYALSATTLAAVEAATGRVIWSREAPAGLSWSLNDVVLAGGVVFTGGYQFPTSQALAFSAATGELLWSSEPFAETNIQMVVSNGHLYVNGRRPLLQVYSLA